MADPKSTPKKSLVLAQAAWRRKARERANCINGHPWTAETTTIVRGTRECRTCQRLRHKRRDNSANVTPEVIRRVFAAIQEGQTTSQICGGMRGNNYVGGKILAIGRLNAFCEKHPRLGRKIKAGIAKNAKLAYSKAGITRRIVAAPAIFRNDAFEVIMRSTAHLFEPIRGVVQSDLWTAVAEGRLRVSEIPVRVQEFVRKYYRDEKHAVDSRWGHRSLDAPIGDDGYSLLDTIPHTGWSMVAGSAGKHFSARRSS